MVKDYILPDQRKAGKRSRNAAENVSASFSALSQEIGFDKKYFIRTYGCQANVRDGETISGLMELMGFERCEDARGADVLIFNTCAIRRAAEEHVLGEIGSLKRFKKQHPESVICICGCMAQEEAVVNEVLNRYPQVDMIFGTHNIERLPELLQQAMKHEGRVVEVLSHEGKIVEDMPVKRSSSCKGFVNIMFGCNKFCTYCIVPYTRGQERSRQKEAILREIRSLQASGRKEVILLGQNVNAYGRDLGMDNGFAQLLQDCAETGIERIRFYTSHPRDYTSETIDVMKKYPNIMNSLHLPVQSGSDAVLKKMNRGYTAEHFLSLVSDMRSRIPDITFTTDLIVGFPSETDEDFRKTLDLVDKCRFDLAYSFVFSPRSGTPAARMEDIVPLSVKKERLQILNERLSFHASENNRAYKGKVLKVLCEGPSKKNPDVFSGYSEENKLVNFTCGHDCTDEILDVEITETHSFSLDGKAL